MPTQDFKGMINGVLPNQIIGDGTAGRVLRVLRLNIKNGASAAHIQCATANLWNGNINDLGSEFAKNETSPEATYTLDATGSALTILNAGLTGSAIAVLSADMDNNLSGTALTIYADATGGLRLIFLNAATGAEVDLTTLVDTGQMYVRITYITSA